MKYLLDTHVILRVAYNDQKISRKVADILLFRKNNIFISAVSFWEISIKFSAGKLNLKHHTPLSLYEGYKRYFRHQLLDLKMSDAVTYYNLTLTFHKDPFDRMLIWQALQNDLILITDDLNIGKYATEGLQVLR